MREFDIAVIGGGPAGSFTAIACASAGFNVSLFEKAEFPRGVLCGEFLSYEVTSHLKDFGLYDAFLELNPNRITAFRLFSPAGKNVSAELNFSAYGVKRSAFDEFLLEEALKRGVSLCQPCEVTSVQKAGENFLISAEKEGSEIRVAARKVIGAFGRRSALDKKLRRSFAGEESRYNGVKIHLSPDLLRNFRKNEIHIYTGRNIYCGINTVNDGDVTVCFLEKRMKGDPPVKEKLLNLRNENPEFGRLLCPGSDEEIINSKIYGTGNIYFGRKEPVDKEIFMAGDAAGIIAPVAGDGIGMAVESGRLLADLFTVQKKNNLPEEALRALYVKEWKRKFRRRIITAGLVQRILFSRILLNTGIGLAGLYPPVVEKLIDYTRK